MLKAFVKNLIGFIRTKVFQVKAGKKCLYWKTL